MKEMHTRVGEPGGPVLCQNCGQKNYYNVCAKCQKALPEPWLRTMEEYKQRLKVASGSRNVMKGLSVKGQIV